MSTKIHSTAAMKKANVTSKTSLSDKELCDVAQKHAGVLEAKTIPSKQVCTAGWVRLKCQFGCDGYGRCLVCPPYTPTPETMRQVLDCYDRALLLHCDKDIDVKALVVELEREIFLKGAWKAFGLGAGSCYLCESCALTDQLCRHAEKARPSMEACGIDVFTTVRQFGFPIDVVKTHHQCPNFYALILVD